MNRLLLFIFLILGFSKSNAQSVTITQPNGSELLYGCQTYQVKWTATGVSNNWNIDYSLNNGAIWTSVSSNLNITPVAGVYTFNWTVPMVGSNIVLIRTRDYSDTTKQDISNAGFTIQLPINITSPNGGETWQGLSTKLITWTPAGTSGVFNLSYSVDNGTNFTSITSNVSANNYTWTVPNNPSTQALIRVNDASTSCQLDLSNAVFTISPAQPILLAPNGGETWTINSVRNITWNTATFHSTVKLEYSTDNGVNYNLISASVPNNGTYAWTIPNTPGNQIKVRASNASGSSVFDESNASFSISNPSNFLTSPNGGEVFRSMNNQLITWDNTVFNSSLKIEYSTNAGSTWNLITSSANNTGSYNWTVPSMLSTNQALIRLTNNTLNTIIDTSDAYFTIKAPVTIDYPNLSSDTLTGCSTINIAFSKSNTLENYTSGTTCYSPAVYGAQYGATYFLYYSTNGGPQTYIGSTNLFCGTHAGSYSWTVPDVATGTIKITISARYNTYAYGSSAPTYWIDSSDFEIPVKNPTGTIVVTAPNGSVNLNALTNYNTTWTANGTSGFFDVLYSSTGLNGSYSTIATNITANSYTWNVNNTPSTVVYLRVQDKNNTCRKDFSNAANTILAATPVLTAPNGGETWNVNSIKQITWNANSLYSSVLIEYSTDNGSNWNIISSAAPNTGTYSWTVPNTVSSTVLVRIANSSETSNSDVSNATFSINLPTPILTSPNGGETWRAGNIQAITWNATTVASSVNIEYSVNNGSTWNTIVNGASNTGTYSWSVPQIFSTSQALIRITNSSFPTAIDTSNAVFTIKAPVTIDYPNLVSDTLTGCSTINISFSKSNSIENYTSGSTCYSPSIYGASYGASYELYYSINGGSWNFIGTTNLSCSVNSGAYSWTVPDVATGTIKLRINARYNTQQYGSNPPTFWIDSSDFEIPVKNPSGTIVVTAPNGSVNLNALTNYNTTWTANGTSGFFDVLYSSTGLNGLYSSIASNITANSFTWNVNNTPSTAVFIRVQDKNNTCRKDNSNAPNTIIAATPVLTAPNGGETWNINTTQQITWNQNTLYNNVLLEYSTDNGSNWNIISSSAPNTGSYSWVVPNNISSQGLVRISNVGNSSLVDVSNTTFSFDLPKPVLTSPNGAETWRAGNIQNITWNTSSITSAVKIEYSTNNGSSWNIITSSTNNTGSFAWSVPQMHSTSQALIRISSSSFTSAVDTSNAVFTIKAPVTIDYPNLVSDTLTGCSTINISFSKSNSIENYTSGSTCYSPSIYGATYGASYELYYSVNGGEWNYIGNTNLNCSVNSGAYSWTVPDVATGTVKLRINARYNTQQYGSNPPTFWIDSSDFEIPVKNPSGTIVVTAPNGSVNLNALTNYNTTWTANGTSGFFDVLYSSTGLNGSYSTIASNITANSYTWNVNNTPSTAVYLRVQDKNNTCRKDFSNAPNTIIAATPVLTAPNGGETWNVNAVKQITWNANSLYSSVLIEYSTDNGSNWNIISSSAPNTGTFNWTVPNTVSTQVFVRISNVGNTGLVDVSNASFSILLPTPILTSPNGGETWRAGNTQSITWNATTVASSVNIEYSVNNGGTWNTIVNGASYTGTYSWSVPQMHTTSQALIRITNSSFPTAIDTSNAVFTIKAPVTIDYPNLSSDTLTGCSTINISFSKSNSIENYTSGSTCYSPSIYGASYGASYELYYSINGGSWNYISATTLPCGTQSGALSWTVPDVATGTVKLRINARYNTQQYGSNPPTFWIDSSDFEIPVKNPSGTIVVTAPNGSVNLNALTNYNTTWTANGTSGFFEVLYSSTGLNGSYSTIASNITANSFTWNVNNTPSTAVFIRVQDKNNTCRKDNSNTPNTIIAATPVLTAPNGGETWNINTTQQITWNQNTLYNNVLLEYSTDNGSNWNIISSSAPNTGSYSWVVPNNISSQGLVRISNVGNSGLVDVSNATFSFDLPKPVLTAPNGAETWRAGNTQNITWNTSSITSAVKIEYSTNNGSSWNIITSSTNNTGSFAWSVPQMHSTSQALIRISSTSFTSAVDTSNAVFTIKAPVTIDYPNLVSDTLTGCSTINISFSKSNSIENYTSGSTCYSPSIYGATYGASYELFYSTNGGSWNSISATTLACGSQSGSISWTVPDVATGTIKLRINARYNTQQYGSNPPTFWTDSSDFEIPVKNPSGTIVVTAPNGSVNLNALTNYNTTWTANGTSGFFDVLYSSTGLNGSYSTIASNITANSYTWNVNNTPSTAVYLRVQDKNNTCRKDFSNSPNTIIAATPVLTAPNGGETWNVNAVKQITWNANSLYSSVLIEYSTDNGSNWNIISSSAPNTGTFNWTVPFISSNVALIRISNTNNPSIFDISNEVFSIQIPAATLTSPNGGETWYAGTSQNITWLPASIFSPTVNLEFSLNGGQSWETIINNISNNGSYNWTIPNRNSANALIRISNNSNTNYSDVSNALMTIRPFVRLVSPNGANQLGSCTQTTITFEKAPSFSSFNLEYSINNGSSWTSIFAAQTYNNTINTYNWTLPNASTSQALMRIYPSTDATKADTSDANFTIRKPVNILQPNFGGVLVVGSTYTIKWQSDGISNLYDISYSTSGPTGTFTNIVLGYNTSNNTYTWTVPNTPSTNCYLKIKDNINPCKEDVSDLAFSIATVANPITITNPNGSDTLSACQTYNITWNETSTTPIGNYNIGYSTDNGTNWVPIVSNYLSSNKSYPWIVPNISSTNVLIRVQSGLNPLVFDYSDAQFRINPGRLISNNDTNICSGSLVQLNTTGGSNYSWTPSTGLSNPSIANPVANPTTTTQYIVSSSTGTCVLSDTVIITVNPSNSGSASVIVSPNPGIAFCSGTTATFTAIPTNGGTNPSYQWKLNNVNVGSNSSIYINNQLANNDVVRLVMTSSLQCLQNPVANSNNLTLTVFPNLAPTATISTSSTSVCQGSSITFNSSITNGGSSPVYQWKKNGNNIGTNSSSYVASNLVNNDIISLDLSSNASCASPSTVSSNSLLMTVSNNVTPSISISSSANNICSGTSVTFTASISNGGSTPVYQWKKNGSNVGTNSSSYITSSLSNNDVITCELSSSLSCVTSQTAGSNSIIMIVSTSIIPSVSITPSATTICSGTSVSFTANPVNGGSSPAYQWKVNGSNVGSNSPNFSTSTLSNSDIVTVTLSSSIGCANPTSAISSGVNITVNPNSAPSISISSNASTICSGTNVLFTANAINAGSNASYQWKVNGLNAGGNSATFNTSLLNNGDSVKCILSSASSCANPNTASSNTLVIVVNSINTPSISIGTASSTICQNSLVSFSSVVTNGGTNPIYQWKINGNNVGTNSANFSTSSIANNDTVRCILTSNISCATIANVSSNLINMSIATNVIPAISISTTSSSICTGSLVSFSASPTNGGSNPAYQWKKNGINVGINSSNYILSNPQNNDVITCILNSSSNCASPITANSNSISLTVSNPVTPSISIVSSANNICSGQNISFTATASNGGSNPIYQWKKNGINIGTNSNVYSSTTLSNNDIITCELQSSIGCISVNNVLSNTITITVNNSLTPTISINTSSSIVCSGSPVSFTSSITNGGANPVYVWKNNGNIISGANNSSYNSSSLSNNDVITCELSSNAACLLSNQASSNAIQMQVNSTVSPSITISTNTPNICNGSNVTFSALILNGGVNPTYQWKINGSNAGTNSSSFSSSSLSNNDAITCLLTSTALCASSNSVLSNGISIGVGNPVIPSVNITANTTSICGSQTATFTANPVNGGSSPIYQWKINSSNAGSNSSTFNPLSLSNGDIVSCQMISNAACASSGSVNSNGITMSVGNSLTPTIEISANTLSVCSGDSVHFTSSITNGGNNPVFTWKINGVVVGTNKSTYSTNNINHNDLVTCQLQSNVLCASQNTVNSNTLTMSLNSISQPNVSIQSSQNPVCSGSSVNFTAIASNAGANPVYTWKLNGNTVGVNSNVLILNSVSASDVVYCQVRSTSNCTFGFTNNSNAITMQVENTLTPFVVVNASSQNICSGTDVSFSANPGNGGTNPSYVWKLNGTVVGSNSAIYTNNNLNQNNSITVEMTSNANCLTKSSAISNPVSVQVNQSVTPTVSVSVIPSKTICKGTNVVFTAIPVNGGPNPIYQWKINGVNSGTNTKLFSSSNFNNLDIITLEMTSSMNCSTIPFAESEIQTMIVNEIPAKPSITKNGNMLSSNSPAGNQWLLNGSPINGATSPNYTASVSGNYSVEVQNSTNCKSVSDIYNFTLTGLGEFGFADLVQVYPNPFSEKFELEISNKVNNPEKWEIEIFDLLGRKIKQIERPQHINHIDLKEESAGVYLIKIKVEGEIGLFRVVKQ